MSDLSAGALEIETEGIKINAILYLSMSTSYQLFFIL